MGDPELHGDESIILKTPNVFVKSIPFEAILTNKRIILIDRKKELLPPKDILLATMRSVEASENAIRDQILTISIITNSGETRQVVLTFSREAGGNRKRERDEWAKALKQHTTSSFQQAIRNVIPSMDKEQKKKPQEPPSQKIEITSRPAGKKEIDIVQPIKKIVETTQLPPVPVETSSLPAGSFCSRCGNRVPPESVFCNRCGSKVVAPGALEMVEPSSTQPAPQPVPQVSVSTPAQVEIPIADQNVPPHIPMVPAEQLERKERPIEEVIRSIEPLIEDSVPRTEPAPLVPSHFPAVPEPAAQPEDLTAIPPAGEPTQQPATAAQPSPVKRSILPQLFLRKDLPQHPAPATIPPVSPPPAESPATGPRRKLYAIIAIIIVIIAVIGGAFVFMKSQQGKQDAETTPAATPPATPIPTPVRTTAVPTTVMTTIPIPTTPPQPLIPQTGVWVKVSYAGAWSGSYGTPGNQAPVSGSGDQLYQIPVKEGGMIQVSFQKSDGSGNPLAVELYKDGTLIKSDKTAVPKGAVDLLVDFKPPATPTVKPTSTQTAVNTTATPTVTPTTSPTGNVTTVQTTTPS
ncbi:MAG: hypothetical protein OS112_08380 [Methanoregula sp.]|nr:MAG: hypothetical protein OS112_08380 [Methanoregula sp.]